MLSHIYKEMLIYALQNLQSSINSAASKLKEIEDSNSSRGPPGTERPPEERKGSREPVFPIHEIVQSLNLPEGTKISIIAESAFQNFQASINSSASKLIEVGDLNSSRGPPGEQKNLWGTREI